MADPQKPAVFVTDFRGLRTISKPQDTSALYSPACKNNYFLQGSCGTRWGTITKFTLNGGSDVFHVELLILASPFTKYYFFLMDNHHLYWTLTGSRTDLLTLPSNTIMFKNTPYQNLIGFLAFSDGFIGTTAPYVITPSIASGVLSSNGTDVTDGKVVVIGAVTYTFKTALTGAANEVLIDSQARTLGNLFSAINGGAGASSAYGTGTVANSEARARGISFFYDGLGSLNGFILVQAILPGTTGNSIATTTDEASLSWSNTTLTGGGSTLLADLMTVAPMAKDDMHATTISPGNITPGHHKIAILYVTRSGYFSSPTRTDSGLPDPIDFTFEAPKANGLLKSDGVNVSAGDTVTLGQQTYTFASPLSGSSVQTFATNTLTFTAQPNDGDTVTIGTDVYTFRTALTAGGTVPFEVLIQAFAGNVASNLEAAINSTGTPGADYGDGTPKSTFVTSLNTLLDLVVTAITAGSDGNTIPTDVNTPGSNFSWPTATLTGGNDWNAGGVPFEVVVGSDAQHSLQNLYEAVTLRGTAGVTYGLGTTQNALATSDGLTSATTCPYYAIIGGSDGNSIATLETSAHLEWDDTITGSPITTFAYGADTLGLILTNIPVHTDSQVVNRWVVMTQADLDSYFLMAEIGDNTSTAFSTPGANDSELGQLTNVDSYFRRQSPLPGAIGLLVYHERLITWGDGDNTSIAKVSEPGEPQAFLEDTGFQEVRRDDGQRLVAAFVLRDFVYYLKERSLHVTSDNGDTPDTWKVSLVAEDIGTPSVNGVDTTGDRGFAAILDPKGIYLFTGAMPQKITNDIDIQGVLSGQGWKAINQAALDTGEIHLDPVNNQIMAFVPTGTNTRPDTVIIGNYREGFDRIKWDSWTTTGTAWRSFIVDGSEIDVATAGPSFRKFDNSVTFATAILTSDNVNPLAGTSVTIGDEIYTFRAALSSANDIFIGVDADTTMNNLIAAINHAAGEGTKYGTGTIANPDVTAGTLSAHAFTVTAIVDGAEGNSIPISTTSTHLSWSGTTLDGGGILVTKTDNGAPINWVYRLGLAQADNYGMGLFSGVIVHVEGEGAMDMKIYGPDGRFIVQSAAYQLSASPDQDLLRRINVRKERIFVEFSQNGNAGDVTTPTITSLSPTSAEADSVGFTLTVNGTGFVAGSIVRWNGNDRPTTYISSVQLQATIFATDVTSIQTVSISVWNPDVNCGGMVRLNSVAIYAKRDGVRVH